MYIKIRATTVPSCEFKIDLDTWLEDAKWRCLKQVIVVKESLFVELGGPYGYF